MGEKQPKKKGAFKRFFEEFKAFINKGNAFMLAVGVVIGGAFNAIVTSLVNILMSLATWGVPGGLKGLVTVLPALTDAQKGAEFLQNGQTVNLQSFTMAEINQRVIEFAAKQGVTVTEQSDTFLQWKRSLLDLYEQHGTTFTYKMSAIIDWGAFINAVIAFVIIGLTLFIIVKIMNKIEAKKQEAKAKALEKYYEKHPEERPVPPEEGTPEPTEADLLKEILCELKKANEGKKKPAEKAE